MLSGKKYYSEKDFLKTFKLIQIITKKSFFQILKISIVNTSPFLHIQKQRRNKKKKTFVEIPFLLKPPLRISYCIKNIIKEINKSRTVSFKLQLSNELIKILKKKSEILKTRKESQEYIFSKKAFSHYRWF